MPINLFPFQKSAVEKFANKPYCLIADEMGTGKSYMAVALDEEHRKGTYGAKTLVVCPLSVSQMWADLFESENYKVSVCDPKDRWAFLEIEASVYIMHWQVLAPGGRKPKEGEPPPRPEVLIDLQRMKFLHIIADEVHKIQSRKAQTTTALKSIKTQYKTALSGTPVTNTPDKLWSILNWLDKKTYSSYWRFRNTYVEEYIDKYGYKKIKGPKNEQRLLAEIEPFYIRRLKADVLPELPPKYYSTITVDLHPKQRRAYNQMRKSLIAWVGEDENTPLPAPVVVAQLMRLSQFSGAYCEVEEWTPNLTTAQNAVIHSASTVIDALVGATRKPKVILSEPSSKLDALMEIITDNPTKKFVVFSNFKGMITLAQRRLTAAGVPSVVLTGDTPQRAREAAIRAFQGDGGPRVFLGTIGAGGVGITLTKSDTVILLDESWSPAETDQAIDRLHRIGQPNAVHVVRIVARDTVDQYRRTKVETKRGWLRRLLGDG